MEDARRDRFYSLALSTVGVVGGLTFLAYQQQLPIALLVFVKVVPILAMLVWLGSGLFDRANRFIVLGLLFAVLGDIGMVFSKGPFFAYAILLNMLFLLCYIAYFLYVDRKTKLLWLALSSVIVMSVYIVILPTLGQYSTWVFVYSILYAIFVWRSISQFQSPSISFGSRLWGLLGALLLVASDSLLGMTIFETIPDNRETYIVVMLLWWSGHLLMTRIAQRNSQMSKEKRSPPGDSPRIDD